MYELLLGKTHPIGAMVANDGVGFGFYCDERLTFVDLLLFAKSDALEPYEIIRLNPLINSSFYFWLIFVKGLPEKIHYVYRVGGPF
ncbi:MAG: glycogen operon protein [Psychromonas sp.]|jgi:glycogen operon protein